VNHFMPETQAFEELGRAYDLVRSRKRLLAPSVGQHSSDRMSTLGIKTPSELYMEFGWRGVPGVTMPGGA
jgi:hypothetical protein